MLEVRLEDREGGPTIEGGFFSRAVEFWNELTAPENPTPEGMGDALATCIAQRLTDPLP